MSDTATKLSAWGALVLSAAAVTMSGWVAVGCHGSDEDAVREEARPASTTVSGRPTAGPAKANEPASVSDDRAAAAPEKSSPASKGADGRADGAESVKRTDEAAADELEIKRLVVTNGIDGREPLKAEQLQAGAGPIYAFVELANRSEADGAVVVSFERGKRRVGNVQLKVPAKQPRWRTWGRTNLIASGGKWDAVVRSADGHELARKSFEVSAPAKAAKSAEQTGRAAKQPVPAKADSPKTKAAE